MVGCKRRGIPAEAMEWYRQVLWIRASNVGCKLRVPIILYICRASSIMYSAASLTVACLVDSEIVKDRALAEEEYQKAAVPGWCTELVSRSSYGDVTIRKSLTSRSSFTRIRLSDDIMDGFITHRGQLCWYRAPAPTMNTDSLPTSPKHRLVSHMAINDVFLIGGGIFGRSKEHFRSGPCYIHLLELFTGCTYNAQLGPMVDLVTAPEGVGRYSSMLRTIVRHRSIVVYKTAYIPSVYPLLLRCTCVTYLNHTQ